jgi:very-short-patch-repair endonuclease
VDPTLAGIAAANGGVFGYTEALAAGYTAGEIRARLANGTWVRLRRGQYAVAESHAALNAGEQHTLACRTAVRALEQPAVVSHESAAALLGLDLHPVLQPQLSTVQVTMLGGAVARRHPQVFAHRIPLDADEWSTPDHGVPVTSAARTALDLAAVRPLAQSIVTADSALRLGRATKEELLEFALRRRRRGKARMMRTVSSADGRSESAGESVSRIALLGQGVPTPVLQYVVGDFRSDFAWPQYRTLGEFDGRLKYTDPDVLWAEKLREDALREAGWELVRWTWAQIRTPAVVAGRLFAAFRRGAARAA